jgi:hypothetical protein
MTTRRASRSRIVYPLAKTRRITVFLEPGQGITDKMQPSSPVVMLVELTELESATSSATSLPHKQREERLDPHIWNHCPQAALDVAVPEL